MNERIFILTGSNQGERGNLLTEAANMIAEKVGSIIVRSDIYESQVWGFRSDFPFLNQALEINSYLPAEKILRECLSIENRLGRVRDTGAGYNDRLIDIDILLIGDKVIQTEKLEVPHPRMASRRFVLLPLAEIAADFIHPVTQRTISEMLASCDDESIVQRLTDTTKIKRTFAP